QIEIPPHIRLQTSPLIVGCAQLQIQLANTARLQALQPRLLTWLHNKRSNRSDDADCTEYNSHPHVLAAGLAGVVTGLGWVSGLVAGDGAGGVGHSCTGSAVFLGRLP